jgi:diguanylate cyclase
VQQASSTRPVHLAFVCLHLHRTDRLSALSSNPIASKVLHEAVTRIQESLRPSDRFAIVSNDEMWFFLPGVENESFALMTAQSIRNSIVEPFTLRDEHQVRATAQMRPSIGLVYVEELGISAEVILRVADEAAERARNMEDRISSVKLKADTLPTSFAEIEQEVQQALFNNELTVHFQPQIDLATNRCVSAEALIRLERPDGTRVRADVIASVCQEGGMIDTLTRYTINTVMRSQMTMMSQGLKLPIAINLSASTLSDSTFPDLIEQSARTWGVPVDMLTIELTEGAIVENEFTAIAFMKRIRALGCDLALDDFGTGYSSFAYLREFPITELKIDKLFVTHIAERDKDRRIVQALLELCRAFDLRSVCEGVENTESRDLLKKLGCDRGQGYFYSPAMDIDKFTAWITNYHAAPSSTPAAALA